MSTERYIAGKKDNGKHDGLCANRKKLEEALAEQSVFEQLLVSVKVYQQRNLLPKELVEYHMGILQGWGLLSESSKQKAH